MRVLVVVAHHDDLELGCGGTVAKWLDEGHSVAALVMTHSGYEGADGSHVRTPSEAAAEARAASKLLGYELFEVGADTHDIIVCDAHVVRILELIERRSIDTVLTHWHGDTHPPHRNVHQMVLHACRRVPRVLGFATNWYLGEEGYDPRFFVAIDDARWRQKLAALTCYESEFQRVGEVWVEHIEQQSRIYGRRAGVPRAEGFIAYKFLWEGSHESK